MGDASKGITITINAATDEALAKLNQFFGGLTTKLNGLTQASSFLSGLGEKIAAAFTVGALVESLRRAIDSMDDLQRAAQKTGLSLDALQAFKKLGRNEKLPFEEITMSLAMLNDKIFQAVRMGGDLARPFRDLHISLTDANGAMLSTEQILAQIMDKFAAMPAGTQKNAEAMELFGRSGREMIPILNQGSEALAKLKAQGGPVSESDAAEAREFNVTLADLAASYNKIFISLAKDLLPSLQDFASWLDRCAKSANETAGIASYMAEVFKVLATAVITLYAVLQQLSTLIAGILLAAIKQLTEAAHGMLDVFTMLKEIFKQIGTIIDDAVHGNFTKMKEDISLLGDHVVFTGALMLETFENVFKAVSRSGQVTWDQMAEQAKTFASALQSIWGGNKTGAKGGTSTSKTGAPGASASSAAAGAMTSEEAKKIEEEVLKQYQEATSSKLQLLDHERQEIKKKLQQEVTDAEDLANALLLVDQTYDAKKRELTEKSADEERKIKFENLQASVDMVQRDPDLTTAERKKQLLPLLEKEKELLQEIANIETARSKDMSRNPDERDQAAKAAAEAQKQLAGVSDDFSKASQSPFDKMLLQLRQQNDLQQEVADNFGKVFNDSIASVSRGITGLIEGTKNWNQALKEIGVSILNTIISAIVEMGVRWIATQLMMAVFGKSLAAASTASLIPIAAAQSAIWAGPAALSTIASYGEAAAQAPAMIAIAEGATQALAFATGGIIPAGERLIRVNESGQEAVLNSRALQFLGPDFVNAVNQGLYGASTVRDRMASSVVRPVTSDAAAYQEMMTAAAAPQGGSNTTVQGHKLTAVFPSSRAELADFLKSAEGEKIIVDTAKRRRIDIGIDT